MSEFDDVFHLVEEAVVGLLRKFTEHCKSEWKLTEREARDEGFSEQYVAGWNAAMTDGIDGALSLFLDEFLS